MKTHFKELTKEDVIDFYNYMSDIFGAKVINKKDSILMKIIGSFLGLIRVLNKKNARKRSKSDLSLNAFLLLLKSIIPNLKSSYKPLSRL